ncbi:MAG: divalent-cation tolerance protein CutA [Thermoprotei archaeon]
MEQALGGWILILITTSTTEEARKIAHKLLEEKLVACVNIVEEVESMYWWKGKIEKSSESLLIIKSRIEKLNEVIKLVKEIHSYTVPEIIAIPIIAGYREYLNWIDESISNT